MKRFAFILTSLLVLSFGLANGSDISLDHVDGLYDATTIATGGTVTFHIRFTVDHGTAVTGSTNGFRIYSPTGASWWTADIQNTGAITTVMPGAMYDGGVFLNFFSCDGSGSDTVGFAGFKMFGTGIPDGFDEIVATITTGVDDAYGDPMIHQLCLDSSFYPPGGVWLWSGPPDVNPDWDGPHCYDIYKVPNLPPDITNASPLGALDHCVTASFDFDAVDQDDIGEEPFTWNLLAGPGGIDSDGLWSYAPTLVDVGPFQLNVQVCDALMACSDGPGGHGPYLVDGSFFNTAPVFTNCPTAEIAKGKGKVFDYTLVGDGVDCDPFSMYLVSVTPAPIGSYSLVAGVLTFNSDPNDCTAPPYTDYDFVVEITDGDMSNTCTVTFRVLFTEPFNVGMFTHNDISDCVYQGQHTQVDLVYNAGSELIGGFDFLLAYDASALTFVGAVGGNIYGDYDWEYFTYRFGPDGNCGNACPSGLLRVVGIAETNNGTAHPSNFLLVPGDVMASLDFLVTDDRTFECNWIPIRYFWMDCGDNTMASSSGDVLFIEQSVTELGFPITDHYSGYPTFTGAQEEDCFVGDSTKVPERFIDFYNGGIQICCADEIDARGDLNLNEIANEIADAVLYSNYFVYGISAFTQNVHGQIAASDVNADGIKLSVADLVYLIRVIVGDANPYPKLNPEAATYSVDNGVVRVNSDMGAAALVIEGNVVPNLMADNMEMRYNFDGVNTRVLVYSMEAGAAFSGDFMNANGNVLSVEMATYEGTPVAAKVIPAAYSLKQNYPNPFNPATTMAFDMAKAGDYTLTIYNVTGQEVANFASHADAGTVNVSWDASNMASGIYFYRLNTNDFSDTKKMVLLK